VVLPVSVIRETVEIIQENMVALANTFGTLHYNSKTPQRVTTPADFAFGAYIGGLKYMLVKNAEKKILRKLYPDEWDEIDNIIIDYHDKIGELIFNK